MRLISSFSTHDVKMNTGKPAVIVLRVQASQSKRATERRGFGTGAVG